MVEEVLKARRKGEALELGGFTLKNKYFARASKKREEAPYVERMTADEITAA
jgi:hypothetical protein